MPPASLRPTVVVPASVIRSIKRPEIFPRPYRKGLYLSPRHNRAMFEEISRAGWLSQFRRYVKPYLKAGDVCPVWYPFTEYGAERKWSDVVTGNRRDFPEFVDACLSIGVEPGIYTFLGMDPVGATEIARVCDDPLVRKCRLYVDMGVGLAGRHPEEAEALEKRRANGQLFALEPWIGTGGWDSNFSFFVHDDEIDRSTVGGWPSHWLTRDKVRNEIFLGDHTRIPVWETPKVFLSRFIDRAKAMKATPVLVCDRLLVHGLTWEDIGAVH